MSGRLLRLIRVGWCDRMLASRHDAVFPVSVDKCCPLCIVSRWRCGRTKNDPSTHKLNELIHSFATCQSGVAPVRAREGVGWFVGGQTGWRSVSAEFYVGIGCRHIGDHLGL
jgi:hypothetical protein